MRGWLHLFSFFGAIVAGAVLIPLASAGACAPASRSALYCLTICGLFGVSALYHRRRWSPRGWRIMKRLDHSMIFLFIAGTYTPFALLAVDQVTGFWVLAVVWIGALAGVTLKMTWPTAPRWVGRAALHRPGLGRGLRADRHPALRRGRLPGAAGGRRVLYTLGGIAYGLKKPNPWPGTFGYHEVFHAMTVVAAICHYIAVYFAMYNSPVRLAPPHGAPDAVPGASTARARCRSAANGPVAVVRARERDRAGRRSARQTRAVRSRSSSVTRLPITRSATVISGRDRIPTGPAAGRSRGRVSRPASRRAMENASP